MRPLVRWRQFCEQSRHCYLLLAVAFGAVLRLSALAMPNLQNTRVRGGLHLIDVLMLMDALQLMWIPFLAVFVLYVASFAISHLNTPDAVAFTALCSTAALALVLGVALMHISI
jgi:hypothetical protein